MSRVKAAEFLAGKNWFNVSRPLSIGELKGKILLLDFWTFCCINCLHVLQELKVLEKKYPEELVVIGVHSGKFDSEKDPSAIRQAILRYEIEHPVVEDSDFALWSIYGSRAWPTLVLIDPESYVVGTISGEGHGEALDRAIQDLIQKHSIHRKPLPIRLEKDRQKSLFPLFFPGKLFATETGRLFVSDTTQHSIVSIDCSKDFSSGKILQRIGTGKRGFRDGDLESAQFSAPQGLVFRENQLYVADTENHSLRCIDFTKRRVVTLVGNGKIGYDRVGDKVGKKQSLNSPWDLVFLDSTVYIAMAGTHQIWTLDLKSNRAKNFAGSGIENLFDGDRMQAQLAQPSGISTDGRRLYFADSEISAVRFVDLETEQVQTLLGYGLFEFGDSDGKVPKARLQHPLGVLYIKEKLFVADTYNHKIKVLDLKTQTLETLIGDGEPGFLDHSNPKKARLFEPSGLSYAQDRLFIADTNNHAIRVYSFEDQEFSTISLSE